MKKIKDFFNDINKKPLLIIGVVFGIGFIIYNMFKKDTETGGNSDIENISPPIQKITSPNIQGGTDNSNNEIVLTFADKIKEVVDSNNENLKSVISAFTVFQTNSFNNDNEEKKDNKNNEFDNDFYSTFDKITDLKKKYANASSPIEKNSIHTSAQSLRQNAIDTAKKEGYKIESVDLGKGFNYNEVRITDKTGRTIQL